MTSELILPAGVDLPSGPAGHALVVNETDLPDDLVQTVVEEHASVLGVNAGTTFGTYANEGSLLARSKFRVPKSVIEEIRLARDLAERDDDVAETMGAMIAVALSEGMQHTHEDETTVALFDKVAQNADVDGVLAELYRELLIASSVTTATVFTRESFQYQPRGADRQRTRSVVAPLVGVLPAEQLRVIGNDLFRGGQLAYRPATWGQEKWLDEFFSASTTAARKAEMRRQDPVLTRLLLEQLPEPDPEMDLFDDCEDLNVGTHLYRLNPTLVHRSSFPKGAWKYPRPLLTRNFALLEAKRLLNIMDYALLQGGANFLIVAKKGSEQRPARPEEIDNLHGVLRKATRTGVIIGDHRLQLEIITPDLKELLNPSKRRMLGRKIATGLLRLPEVSEASAGGGQAVIADVELLSRVISYDRKIIRRHVENRVYDETARRNPGHFPKGAPGIWQPKIILQGTQYFTDLVLKLNDRGAISRRTAVEAGGFDYEHEVEQRRREKSHGDDRVMAPPQIPFSSPNGAGGPNDNGGGRPSGGSSANGAPGSAPSRSTKDPARPSQVIRRTPGETVRALWDEEHGTLRIGELTFALLEQYQDSRADGRLTAFERRAVARLESEAWPEAPVAEGPLTIVAVNPEYDVDGVRAVRLAPGLSLLVGRRPDDDAIVTRALVFRSPEFTALDADELAQRWGFATRADSPEAA